MFRKITWFYQKAMFCILLSVALIACKPSDGKLAETIKTSIAMIDPGIQVAVNEGVVTLSGEVSDEATKSTAENSIKEVKGVKSVVNNISVEQVEVAPPVTVNPDMVIKNTIDSSFTNNNISGITVSVANGEVTLTGNVTRSNLVKVMQAANESKPKKVINKLTISPK